MVKVMVMYLLDLVILGLTLSAPQGNTSSLGCGRRVIHNHHTPPNNTVTAKAKNDVLLWDEFKTTQTTGGSYKNCYVGYVIKDDTKCNACSNNPGFCDEFPDCLTSNRSNMFTEAQVGTVNTYLISGVLGDLEAPTGETGCYFEQSISNQVQTEDFAWGGPRPMLHIIHDDTNGDNCYADIGRSATADTTLSIGGWCLTNKGFLKHLVMHTLGMIDEHQRPDRADYLNMVDTTSEWCTINPWKTSIPAEPLTTYDFKSIMHLPGQTQASTDLDAYAGCWNGLTALGEAMRACQSVPLADVGYTWLTATNPSLSALDSKAVDYMYGNYISPNNPITDDTNLFPCSSHVATNAPTAPPTPTPPPTPPSPPPPPSEDESLPVEAIVGIVLGSATVLGGGIKYWFENMRKGAGAVSSVFGKTPDTPTFPVVTSV